MNNKDKNLFTMIHNELCTFLECIRDLQYLKNKLSGLMTDEYLLMKEILLTMSQFIDENTGQLLHA